MNSPTSYRLLVGALIDGSGEPARRRVQIDVEEGTIVRIDPVGDGTPAVAVLDHLQDTVLPFLVDSHVHLFMSGTGDPEARTGQLEAGFSESAPQLEARIRRHMACGVMAVRDGGDAHGHALRFRRELLDRCFPEFILHTAGRAWRSRGRYGKLIGRAPAPGNTLADAVAADETGIDHVKIVNSGLNSLLRFGKTTPPQFSTLELQDAVRAAGKLGRRVMVHANGRAGVGNAVDAGCHSIEHGFFMGPENLAKMADRGTVWVPTAVTMKAYAEALPKGSAEADGARRNLDHQLEQLRMARDLGVAVAVGSDAGSLGVHHGSGCIEEIGLLVTAGYTVEEAVSCATRQGARLLGIDSAGRRLRPGRPARFLVCAGSPDGLPGSLYKCKRMGLQI